MNMKRTWLAILALMAFAVAGCNSEYGKVAQGKVIKYDKEKKSVTLVLESAHHYGTENQVFDKLPPVVYTLPADPMEMGPEPKAGMRMLMDPETDKIIYFDEASGSLKTVQFQVLDKQKGVSKDDARVVDKKFPIIDKDKKTLTVYSSRWKTLVTLALPDEYMALPASTWDSGDIVRIYYKEEGKALRFMNVSKTNIFKK
ncbi:DUF4881 domain-containing protein [Desulfovibrio aminophilus]|uniref:DUF4881 domain-containing protein n=1 Tax=Desulfovibrio aminophilus TaxID=81425 RepID=UPI0004222BD3|nr:DUF4881 domain-containing protein [Desulfovibrio aminophilus]